MTACDTNILVPALESSHADHQAVTHFATANGKHFQGFGFQKIWNPLAA
jgi:hypothetical protein